MPCISTDVPWQAWFFGRKGDPAKPFKWTYHFFWGLEDIIAVFMDMWARCRPTRSSGPSTRTTATATPGPTRSAAFRPRSSQGRLHADQSRAATQNPTTTSRADRGVQEGERPDRHRRAAAARLRHVLEAGAPAGLQSQGRDDCKALLFPSAVEALGNDGAGMSTEVWWRRSTRTSRRLTKQTAAALAAQWTKTTKKQWTQPIGSVSRAVRGGSERLWQGRRTSTTRSRSWPRSRRRS